MVARLNTCLACVKEADLLPQQAVKECSPDADIQPGHSNREQTSPDPSDHCACERCSYQLHGGDHKLVTIRVNACIVYDEACEVGYQGLPQRSKDPCTMKSKGLHCHICQSTRRKCQESVVQTGLAMLYIPVREEIPDSGT